MATKPVEGETVEAQVVVGRRGASRARTQLNGRLQTVTRDLDVVIRNVSRSGAMIEGADLPSPGKTVALKRRGLDVLATVVWSRQGKSGLSFFDPISDEDVLAHARSAVEAPPPRAPYNLEKLLPRQAISIDDWNTSRTFVRRGFRSHH